MQTSLGTEKKKTDCQENWKKKMALFGWYGEIMISINVTNSKDFEYTDQFEKHQAMQIFTSHHIANCIPK